MAEQGAASPAEAIFTSLGTGEGESGADTGNANAGADKVAVSEAAGSGDSGKRTDAAQDATGKPAGGDVQPDAAGGAKPDAASGAAEGGDGGVAKTVPLAALQEAREANRTLKAEIEALKAKPSLSSEDAALLKSLREQQKDAKAAQDAAEAAVPDFLQDPKGYIDATVAAAKKAADKAAEDSKKVTEANTAREQFTAVVTGTQARETAFIAKNPDYYDAVNHIRAGVAQETRMLYPDATDAQINEHIGRQEIAMAAQLLAAGKDPAEFAYNLAKTRGYVPKAAAAAGAAGAGNGGAKPAADKDAARSLGGGGGSEATGDDVDESVETFNAAVAERFGAKAVKRH